MHLSDAIAADRATLLDCRDFAEELVIDGRRVTAQVDSDRLGEVTGYQSLAMGLDGTVVYARTEDLPPRKAPGARLTVNGSLWTVASWEDEAGISQVVLQRPE